MKRRDYKEFKTKYNLLAPVEQDILKILALMIQPVVTGIFLKILYKAEVNEYEGNLLKAKRLQEILERMDTKNFVEFLSPKKCRVKDAFQRHLANEASFDSRKNIFIRAIQEFLPGLSSYSGRPNSYEVCLREMQFALLSKNDLQYQEFYNLAYQHYKEDARGESPEAYFFFDPLNVELLNNLSKDLKSNILNQGLFGALEALKPIDELTKYLADSLDTHPNQPIIKSILAKSRLFRGEFKGNEALFEHIQLKAIFTFLKGENDTAVKLFAEALKIYKKERRKKNVFFNTIAGPFNLVALLKVNKIIAFQEVLTHTKNAQANATSPVYQYLRAVAAYLTNQSKSVTFYMMSSASTGLDWIFKGMATYWISGNMEWTDVIALRKKYEEANQAGLKWFVMEFAFILSKYDIDETKADFYAKVGEDLQTELGIQSMITAVKKVEEWERVLQSLEALVTTGRKKLAQPTQADARIIWLVDFKEGSIQPKEQKKNKKGSWTKGRNVALKKLHEGAVDAMTAYDRLIAKAIIADRSYGYYGNVDYYFDNDKAFKAMIGHPLLFRYDNPTIPIELTEVKPELIIEEKPGRFEIKFSHPISGDKTTVNQETPTRFNLVNAAPAHLAIAKALGGSSVAIPSAAKKQLGEILKNIGNLVPVHSALAHTEEDLPTKRGNANIHVHILPFGDGFKLEMFAKPLVTEPPYFKPGKGRKEFVAEIKKKRTLVKRTLSREKENAKKVETECPTLQQVDNYQGEWTFEEVETCLNILLELEPLKESGLVTLEWPKGEKVRLNQHAGFGQFSMRIDRDNDWFGVTGELKLDNDQVLDMKRLLELVGESDSQFVEISEGQFIALTKNFRKRLSEMNSLFDKTKDGLRVNGLAAAAMEDFTSEIKELEVAKEWKQQVNRLKRARKMKTEVPSTFQADLRTYQYDGYQWLTQLAYWGVGACLADDMGLGKTVQGLAVLVERAKNGPALVIAPASVCRNWRKECRRFAPTLNPIIFGQGDRKETIKNLKPFDLLISTYGLLQSEAALFTKKKFNTIILDEAQAIKNKAAKRSKAAMNLKGDFKIITTGTPIENHLGELWNLFNFINPGLLGTTQSFQEKYALPIEKYQNKDARNSLKKLIQPFILRRKKNDVLEELPSKTEITLSVELSNEERVFYEALRQKAIEKIEENDEKAGHPGMQILAQITRLRQACCNPKLVQAGIQIPSAKLELFGEVLEELVENGHKALVFSQFVGHLKIIEDFIKAKNIPYQYLDGSTTPYRKGKTVLPLSKQAKEMSF